MITDIQLQYFRSYEDVSFDFGPEVNIIVGPNASGKTNLLESLLLMARGTSFRARDAELVAFDAPWARIDAVVDDRHRVVKLQRPTDDSGRATKVFEIDEQPVSRLHHSKVIPVVLFEPNHLLLLSSVPDLRRTFLDDLIEQTDATFGHVRRQYRRVLAQRNALLKRNPADLKQQLFVWNLRLSELGGRIAQARQALIADCNRRLPDIYNSLVRVPVTVELRYETRFTGNYETVLLHKLEQNVELDVLRGFTVYGPHRDDLTVLLNGHVLQEAASRGETRTVILALKIVELQFLEAARGVKPILLLDDVFSELDMHRRTALTAYVERYQTFITATEADTASKHFKRPQQVIAL
jgi:DNA replication and repair protein RecF